ncbi:MAG: ABC transporter permease [Treponema sp.]|jgi:lipoprotein-releasing system permease protein|nr:ABC transporter permease [Treponema sp.]
MKNIQAKKPVRWISFVALRYISRSRRNSPSPVFAVLGIVTGVLALTVIIAVMNGFQLGFIESILEISSFHIRSDDFRQDAQGRELTRELKNIPGVSAAIPFREFQGILRGKRGGQQGAVIRGLPPDVMKEDTGFAAKLEIEGGAFSVEGKRSIVLGRELARRLYADVGDEITLISVSGLFLGDDSENEADDSLFTVAGIYRSGFYEYDMSWGFINIETAASLEGEEGKEYLGVKLRNRWNDEQIIARIKRLLEERYAAGETGVPVFNSWRNYNRAFFGALRTEKLLMFVLVGLIFIVVGLNIFQGQRRNILERREEIGLMRALGAADWAVQLVFIWDGFITGILGAGIGMILGLLVASNIASFFTALETVVNFFIAVINTISGFFSGYEGAGEFAIFSPRIFYIKEIPSRVIPVEAFLIFMFGFLSSLLAAAIASFKVSRTRPAEVLRYE